MEYKLDSFFNEIITFLHIYIFFRVIFRFGLDDVMTMINSENYRTTYPITYTKIHTIPIYFILPT